MVLLPDAESRTFYCVPESAEGLMKAVGETHRRNSGMINLREGWRGYFWQGRFSSYFVMDDTYLLTAARYIELNPVRARLVKKPEAYKWSSYPR